MKIKIKDYLTKNGITQEKFAEKINLSKTDLSKMLNPEYIKAYPWKIHTLVSILEKHEDINDISIIGLSIRKMIIDIDFYKNIRNIKFKFKDIPYFEINS